MRFIFLFFCCVPFAVAKEALIDQHDYPSPDHQFTVHYERRGDFSQDSDAHLSAVVTKGNKKLWSLSEIGRHSYFSWSPDSRFLLVAYLNPGRAMDDLIVLDTAAKTTHGKRLSFASVKSAIDARASNESGQEMSASYDGGVDWESINWVSSRECQMRFGRAFFGKRGNALLELDLRGGSSRLKIVKITSPP